MATKQPNKSLCRLPLIYLFGLCLAGCASLSPPTRDGSHDYIPGKQIAAAPGSPENPDAGAGFFAGLFRWLAR
jgi:hypothetical protein